MTLVLLLAGAGVEVGFSPMPSRFLAPDRLIWLVLLAACADPPPQEPRVDLTTVLQRADALGAPGVRGALGSLGLPLEAEARPFPSPYDPAVVDSVRTLRHEGLTVDFYWVSTSGQELIQSITLESGRFDAGLGFGVGAERAAVIATLGEPGRTDGRVWSWDLYEGPDDPIPTALIVELDAEGRVSRIRFDYYMG